MRAMLLTLAACLCIGCQTVPLDYATLSDKIANGNPVEVAALRQAFLDSADLPDRMERLENLELQAAQLVEDEPLKLGSLGTAILDTYYGSLTGHYVLMRFYEYVGSEDAALPHREWLERIRADMQAGRDGSREEPYPAVTAVEAQMFAVSQGMSPVGSIYQTSEAYPFTMLLQAKPQHGGLVNLHFDLTSVYVATAQQFGSSGADAPEFSPFSLIGYLAKRSDTAAQTAIGAFLSTQDRLDDAADWLHAASRTGNVLANSILARIYWEKASVADDDATREAALAEVMENYLHAIALGSADSMYALAVLYLNGHYGEDNRASGLPLLNQAAQLDHSDAAMFLAHLYYAGEVVDGDLDEARRYYVQASNLGNGLAQRSYARFLLDRETGQAEDPQVVAWLEALADDGDADAMILLGNLYARGMSTKQSARSAVRWFKAAVKAAPRDASVVNEVAWTLTVSDIDGLRHERYALDIMDALMSVNTDARQRPEYLDTWAAAMAANGDFPRAVALQQEALALASAQALDGVLDVLQQHLDAFRAGETITEQAP